MSWEAYGDDDDGRGDYREQLIDAGWWASEDVDEARDMLRALCAEELYEGGALPNGVSVRFLMRLTLLRNKFGLLPDDAVLVAEAKAALTAESAT